MTQTRDAWADDALPVWDQMLAGIPGASRQPVEELTGFSPMVGQRYAGELARHRACRLCSRGR